METAKQLEPFSLNIFMKRCPRWQLPTRRSVKGPLCSCPAAARPGVLSTCRDAVLPLAGPGGKCGPGALISAVGAGSRDLPGVSSSPPCLRRARPRPFPAGGRDHPALRRGPQAEVVWGSR